MRGHPFGRHIFLVTCREGKCFHYSYVAEYQFEYLKTKNGNDGCKTTLIFLYNFNIFPTANCSKRPKRLQEKSFHTIKQELNEEKRKNQIKSNHNIGCILSATRNGVPVLARTSSVVTPSANSINVRPWVKSTSNTQSSVIIRLTQALPVRGNSHCFKILGLPLLSVCSIVTTTLVAEGFETRSIAPPKPLIFPGSIPNRKYGEEKTPSW